MMTVEWLLHGLSSDFVGSAPLDPVSIIAGIVVVLVFVIFLARQVMREEAQMRVASRKGCCCLSVILGFCFVSFGGIATFMMLGRYL